MVYNQAVPDDLKPVGSASSVPLAILRWVGTLFVLLTLQGAMAFWRPGYRPWSIISAGILACWVLWMVHGMIRRDSRLPGHPVYYPLLVLIGLLCIHLVRDQGLLGGKPSGLGGGIDMSLLFHASLIALGVIVTQSATAEARFRRWTQPILAMGMMLSAGVLLWIAPVDPCRAGLLWMGLAGVLLWVSSEVWKGKGLGPRLVPIVPFALLIPLRTSAPQGWLAGGVTAAACLLLAWKRPARRRNRWLMWVGLTVACVLAVLAGLDAGAWRVPALGSGERAFAHVTPAGAGLEILWRMVGWAGGSAILLGLWGAVLAMLLWGRRDDQAEPILARVPRALAGAAALLATLALLAKGSYSHPAVYGGAVIAWSLLPKLTGWPSRQRRGIYLLAVMAAVMLAMALANDSGSPLRMALLWGLDDKWLHGMAGFLLAMGLAWWAGAWRWWAGLIALAIAALAGFGGEAAQRMYTSRNFEQLDAWAHVKGASIATALYLLCLAARFSYKSNTALRPRFDWLRKPSYWASGVVALLAVIPLVFWLLVTGILIVSIWSGPVPTLEVTDALVAVPRERKAYLSGVTNCRTPGNFSFVYSVSAQGHLQGSWASMKTGTPRMIPYVSEVSEGKSRLGVFGWPMGPLAWIGEDIILVGVPSGSTAVLVDADLLMDTCGGVDGGAARTLALLQSIGPPAVFCRNPSTDFALFRHWARLQDQPIPVFCEVAAPNGVNWPYITASRLLREASKPWPRVVYITSKVNRARLARRYFGKRCSNWLIRIKPSGSKPTKDIQRHFDSMDELTEMLESGDTPPRKKNRPASDDIHR